jgi:hypothetical protein
MRIDFKKLEEHGFTVVNYDNKIEIYSEKNNEIFPYIMEVVERRCNLPTIMVETLATEFVNDISNQEIMQLCK